MNSRTTKSQTADATHFAFIGGGQMASALIGGLVNAGTASANILVIEPNQDQRQKLDERWHVQTGAAPDERLLCWCRPKTEPLLRSVPT